MKLLKNKKGSQIVESVLMWAFSVAAGGACIVYMGGVINESKNLNLNGGNAVLPTPIQSESSLIESHRYRIDTKILDDIESKKIEDFSITFKASNSGEMEQFKRNTAISGLGTDSDGNFSFTISFYNCNYCNSGGTRNQWQIPAQYGPSFMYLDDSLADFSFVYVSHTVNRGSILTVLPYLYEL